MRVIFTGGGTAGHVTPAQAMIEEIKKRGTESEILFIGRSGGKETKPITSAGITTKLLEIEGLERRVSLKNAKKLLLAIKALRQSKKIIKEFSPDIIVGTGGYVCWPVIRAGQRMGIPTVIHESNSSPGLTTRLLSAKCSAVLLNTEGASRDLKCKSFSVVGTPTLSAFFKTDRAQARKSFGLRDGDVFILSFGGSLGAENLNKSVLSVMKNFSAKTPKVKHLHATGRRYYSDLKSEYNPPKSTGCRLVEYIDKMPPLLNAADIVICRAGALTLTELALCGVASVLVPSPNVTGNHQVKNAREYSEKGAAIMIEEGDALETRLLHAVTDLVAHADKRREMAEKICNFGKKDAAKAAVDIIFKIGEKQQI